LCTNAGGSNGRNRHDHRPRTRRRQGTADRLAELTRRSRPFLSAEALEIYTRNELEVVEQIAEGLEDIKAGRTAPHEEVVAETRVIIDAAYARQTAKKAVNE